MGLSLKQALLGLAVAPVLALTCLTARADSAVDVKTRNERALERDYGRASGDAYWQERSSQDLPAPIVKAFQEAKHVATQPPTQWPPAPQRYGRAGGYEGLDSVHANRHTS
jgi:hypothetical protein